MTAKESTISGSVSVLSDCETSYALSYPASSAIPSGGKRSGQLERGVVQSATAHAIVRVRRGLREQGHAAGVPEERESVRMALDLAPRRSLPAPGRRELVEALQP
jgi:hypothetical protein